MNTENPNPDFSKIFTSLRKARRVFRRKQLSVTELVRVAEGVAVARESGVYIDVYLDETTRAQCFRAICRFMHLEVTRRCHPKPFHCPFGFDCISWKVRDGLIINLISCSAFREKGVLWILDMSGLYTDREFPNVKDSKRHAVFLGVKKFISK